MKKKTSKKWEKSTIRICSRTFDLCFDPNREGGEFTSSFNGGRGRMIVGTKIKSLDHVVTVLVHEILEAILAIDGKRFVDKAATNMLFTFDHNYLGELGYKVVDALKSSKCFEINGEV